MDNTAAREVAEMDIIDEASACPLLYGKKMQKLPDDLYIPPDALQVFLEAFEGPLDLLLYLIRKHNLDILDVPIADITRQYVDYIALMTDLKLELAADYLVMAAMLAEIKSRMLLPRPKLEDVVEEDPRAQLIRRLQEYERFKKAAEELAELPCLGKDLHVVHLALPTVAPSTQPFIPQFTLQELVRAFYDILKRCDIKSTHRVMRENLSVRERMSNILGYIQSKKLINFVDCFTLTEGRMGVVVSFLAILELLKLGLIDIVQLELFGPIHLKAIVHDENEEEHEHERELETSFDG